MSNFIKLYLYVRRIGIRNRLIITFLIISLLPILLLGLYSSYNALKEMETRAKNYSINITEQIVNNVTFLINGYVNKFERVALNQTILDDISNYGVNKYYKKFEIENRMWRMLTSITGNDEGINSVEICTIENNKFYISTPITRGSVKQSNILQDAMNSDEIVWKIDKKEALSDSNVYIILAKKLKMQLDENIMGFAVMTINRDYIDNMCQQNIVGNQYVVLTDVNGKIISHPNNYMIMKDFDSKILKKIDEYESKRSQDPSINKHFKIRTKDGLFLVSYDVLERNHWRVINLIPYSTIFQNTLNQIKVTFIIIIMLIIIILIFSFLVTESIHIPVNNLISKMKKVGSGNLDIKVVEDGITVNDEYAHLALGFNKMISRLKNLINDVYESELKKKELEYSKKQAELSALQQQINPHFLYNTLESIYWSAQLKGDEEISEMVTALGDFFRANISRGVESITIEQEVLNVRNYILLQKMRFNERFDCEWEIDESILKYKTIKLILQPIIDRFIVNGIEDLQEKVHVIIKICKKEHNIVFEVIGNVKEQDRQDSIMNRYINSGESQNVYFIDIRNLNKRIKLFFGDGYGLNIDNTYKEGIRAVIIIPMVS